MLRAGGTGRVLRHVVKTASTLGASLRNFRFRHFAESAGEVHQRTETNPRQATIFKALAMPEPLRFLYLVAAPADA
jgi:hypothetical protein